MTFDLNGLGEAVGQVPLYSLPVIVVLVGRQGIRTSTEAPHDLRKRTAGELPGDIGPTEGPKAEARTVRLWGRLGYRETC